MNKGIQFNEVQQFRENWLWYLLIGTTIAVSIPLIILVAKEKMNPKEGMFAVAIVMGTMFINIAVFYYTRLETKISDQGIAYRWWPFFKKFSMLPWDKVEYVAMARYSPLQMGFHLSPKYGRVHKVGGSAGFQVILTNGKKYFFGTQRKLSVESVLHQTGKLKL